jgi:nitrogen regulatory protein PII-like uncharacterized protein
MLNYYYRRLNLIFKEKSNKKLFNTPKSVFQQKVNEIMHQIDSVDLFKDLIKLYMFKECEKQSQLFPLTKLYNQLGPEKFCDVLAVMENETVKFPDIESFKETIEVVLCFYLKQYKGMSWEEIKEVLQEEENFSGVKIGINISKFQKFLSYISEQKLFKYIKDLNLSEEDFSNIRKMIEKKETKEEISQDENLDETN